MRNNIPAELRDLPQWVVAAGDKNPRNPRTGDLASVTDPASWGTFYEALHSGYQHIGFVLTKSDPFCIIDLDEPLTEQQAARHRLIVNAFWTYTEVSQSGKGVHIVCKGSIPMGCRRDKVEVYSDGRYMIFTGNVMKAAPICDYGEAVNNMYLQMHDTVTAELVDQVEVVNDEKLYEIAANAANGAKFVSLFAGQMNGYPSQSEADFALLSIIAFYSLSNEQCRRVFRMSVLGRRDKALRNDDYLNRALSKIRGKQAPTSPVDISGFMAKLNAPVPEVVKVEVDGWVLPPLPVAPIELTTPPPLPPQSQFPPGLVGDIAQYILASSWRPVPEISLVAAISFVAGIVGRHFNISGLGLNHYLILLAKTGTGKEGIQTGHDRLVAACAQHCKLDEFMGPAAFASGQAVTRRLDEQPCFVSVLGEVGLLLKQWCAPDANAINVQLRRVFLDLYGKSGFASTIRPSVYSDTEKNTNNVKAPNVTVMGESTPENFYGALDVAHVSEGLIPRFIVIEYEGPRPPLNMEGNRPPDPDLVKRIAQMAQCVFTMKTNDTCCVVTQDREAASLLLAFNEKADDRINRGEDEMLKQLWNRAHVKAMKLAALIAVGVSHNAPIVTAPIARWSIDFIQTEIENMIAKFMAGEVGEGDHKALAELEKAVTKWGTLEEKHRRPYSVPSAILMQGKLIPYAFFRTYLGQRAAFKNHKLGAARAVQLALEDAVKLHKLSQLPILQAKQDLNTESPVYYVP